MAVHTSPHKSRRLFVVLAIGLALAAAVAVVPALVATRSSPQPVSGHAWVILMENRADTSIIGSRSAPYLTSLAQQYGLADNYHALVHGSQPNYIALFSGGLQGVKGNEMVSLTARNLADQLEAAGKTWRVYAQNVPSGCFTGADSTGGPDGPGTYARKHEPAISFSDIADSPGRCANIQNFSSFDPIAADFEFIVPNLENDMHNGTTKEGDDFLRGFVPRILASAAWKAGSPLFITWDEGKAQGDNKIVTFVIANTVTPGFKSKVPHTHYSLLHTIESLFGLPCLDQACHANTLAEFFPSGLPTVPPSSP